jgi:hypothetical protein
MEDKELLEWIVKGMFGLVIWFFKSEIGGIKKALKDNTEALNDLKTDCTVHFALDEERKNK